MRKNLHRPLERDGVELVLVVVELGGEDGDGWAGVQTQRLLRGQNQLALQAQLVLRHPTVTVVSQRVDVTLKRLQREGNIYMGGSL